MNTINHLDLFSGVGGFSLGLREAGVQVGWHGFSDIDKFANNVYRERFPDAEELGSIENINIDKLPRIDLVTFGFPCQDLSIAGRRKGFDGSRSSLFFKAIEIIERKKPQYFVFENVKGFYSSNAGKDFTTALQTVADIGYDGGWQLLNTRWFLPQNRERIYFVGHIRGECRPKVFPIREAGKVFNDRKAKVANTLQHPGHSGGNYKGMNMIDTGLNQIGVIGKDSEATRVYDTTCARTIKNGGGMGAKTGLYKIPEATKKGYAVAEEGDSINLSQPESKTRRGRVGKGVAQTLDTGMQQYTIQKHNYSQKSINKTLEKENLSKDDVKALDLYNHKAQDISPCLTEPHHNSLRLYDRSQIRRLTPVECERLQGFPDGWTEGQSDTQRYKQMGNAVSVPVVKSIMEKLYK